MWLYLPSSVLLPGAADSTQELPSHSADRLAQSASWRTKSLPPARWSQAWKRNSWMMRLSGVISSPSTAILGVASWTASLAVTRVSHSASQDGAEEQTTPATSGRTSPTSFGQLSLDGVSSKTSPVICDWDFEKSPTSFEAWATALRRHCGARRKSALLTDESGFSSSQWQTPAVDSFRSRGGDRKNEMGLDQQARAWPTPSAVSYGTNQGGAAGRVGPVRPSLETLAKSWPTPSAHDGRRPGSDATSTQGANLKRDAEQWATPTSRDWKDGSEPSEAVPTNSLLGRQAPRAMYGTAFPPSSGPRRLNPLFVAWLMGPYWLALIGYESSATASFQSRQQQPSESCGG